MAIRNIHNQICTQCLQMQYRSQLFTAKFLRNKYQINEHR